jgi:hypothetical protein
MDPTLNSLAYKLRAEMLADSAHHQARKSERGNNLVRRMGGLLVTLGQKMQASGSEAHTVLKNGGYPSLDEEARI